MNLHAKGFYISTHLVQLTLNSAPISLGSGGYRRSDVRSMPFLMPMTSRMKRLQYWEKLVARAAPATPMPKPNMSTQSPTRLATFAKMDAYRGVLQPQKCQLLIRMDMGTSAKVLKKAVGQSCSMHIHAKPNTSSQSPSRLQIQCFLQPTFSSQLQNLPVGLLTRPHSSGFPFEGARRSWLSDTDQPWSNMSG